MLAQLGSADGLFTLSGAAAALSLPAVDTVAKLGRFLAAYQTQVLIPLDLPAICRAHQHATRNQARELVALDRELSRRQTHHALASASQRVGQNQLRCLRPLRDERVVRRYLQAVEDEQAHAWHTLVYGLTLAVYSLPVRQGLLNYARQTLRGFICAAARPLRLSALECRALVEKRCEKLPRKVEALLAECTNGNDF